MYFPGTAHFSSVVVLSPRDAFSVSHLRTIPSMAINTFALAAWIFPDVLRSAERVGGRYGSGRHHRSKACGGAFLRSLTTVRSLWHPAAKSNHIDALLYQPFIKPVSPAHKPPFSIVLLTTTKCVALHIVSRCLYEWSPLLKFLPTAV